MAHGRGRHALVKATREVCRRSRSLALACARKRPPRVSPVQADWWRNPLQLGVVRKPQTIETTPLLSTELNRTRFAWFKTKAAQRPKIGARAVSEVRSALLTPFEIKRNFGAQIGTWGVRNMIVAEGANLPANSLGGMLRMCRWRERTEAKARISRIFADQAGFTAQDALGSWGPSSVPHFLG